MLVKICGLTDVNTARLAVENGADFIGLLFSKVSPRAIDLETAKAIAAAVREMGAEPVAVFADETLEQMLSIIEALKLKTVQLHGEIPRKNCDALPSHICKIYVPDGKALPKSLKPDRDFLLFERHFEDPKDFRFFIAGGLTCENVQEKMDQFTPHGVDVSSGVEITRGRKDTMKIAAFLEKTKGRFGKFGGRYVPELLATPLQELSKAYRTIGKSGSFQKQFTDTLKNYAGRPTALTEVPHFAAAITRTNVRSSKFSSASFSPQRSAQSRKLSQVCFALRNALGQKILPPKFTEPNVAPCGGPRIFLKREDLLHTGAHKINNAIGQCLLAKLMGKTRIIAETGAGQHGVATATACALFGLECVIYMGQTDIERQAPNVAKMRLLGAKVIPVTQGSATLKDAVNEALRDWAESFETTHYCLGSALGPSPFPEMVAEFQQIIGKEAKEQLRERIGRDPDLAIACVGGGSNAIGLFSAYLNDPVQLVGVEAGGKGKGLGNHAARFQEGSPGVLHGTYTYLLQDDNGQVSNTHSISAGLDYPAVGPQHADLYQKLRATYDVCSDEEALSAFQLLAKTEGIIPALESSHALGYLMRIAPTLPKDAIVLVNLSGRGDKDLPRLFEKELAHVAHN